MQQTALSPRRATLYRALRHGGLVFGVTVVVLIVAVALLAPLIAPFDPAHQSLTTRLLPPAWMEGGRPDHWLGTDHLGRDYLSRLIYGARVSLIVGIAVMVISGIIGTFLGFLGGYFGGRVDAVVMYVITTRLSMPGLLVALAVMSLLGGSLITMIAVLSLLFWDRYAVVVRTATRQIRNAEFVAAARVAGASHGWVIWNEIRPNVMHHILVVATLEMAMAILSEASLSFLGLGIQPPFPSWGSMLTDAREMIRVAPWAAIFPGLAIFLSVLGFNLLGDGLRDSLDPHMRTRKV